LKEVSFSINSCFEPVINSACRYIDVWGGRGRGGSFFVTEWFLHKIMQPEYFRAYFMRSILNDVRESLFRDFNDRIEEKEDAIDISDFNIDHNKMTIQYLPTGNLILSKGFRKSQGSATAKLKSIAGATHIAIEECEEISEDDFTTLDVSLRTVKTKPQIFRIWNPPPKDHWLIKNNYELTPVVLDNQKGEDQEQFFLGTPKNNTELLSIFSTYKDNEQNLDKTFIEVLEGFKETNPEYYYTNVRGYITSGKKGRIFRNYIKFKDLPQKKLFTIFGLDFGYEPDPTVLVRLDINREQKELYITELHRQLKMSIEEIYTVLKKHNPNKCLIVCDNAEKREFNALLFSGIPIMKSKKGPGSRKGSRELIKNFKMFVHEGSTEFFKELENHTWALDANKQPTGQPIDGWDHGIDGVGYALSHYIELHGLI